MQNLERPPNASAIWPGDSQRLLGNNERGNASCVKKVSGGQFFMLFWTCFTLKAKHIAKQEAIFQTCPLAVRYLSHRDRYVGHVGQKKTMGKVILQQAS